MSDDELDLEALGRQWRTMDMQTLQMTAETGREQARANASIWLTRGLLLAMTAAGAVQLVQGVRGDMGALTGGALYAVGTLALALFARRQARQIRDADALLAEGTPGDVLRARITLIDVELHAFRSPGARVVKWGVAPLIVLAVAATAWTGGTPWAVPVAIALFFVAFHVFERWRVPRLLQRRAVAAALLQQL